MQPPHDVADEWDRLRTAWRDMAERLEPELVDGEAVGDWGKANC